MRLGVGGHALGTGPTVIYAGGVAAHRPLRGALCRRAARAPAHEPVELRQFRGCLQNVPEVPTECLTTPNSGRGFVQAFNG